MIKSLTAIGIAVLLLLGAGLFEWYYVTDQFDAFGEELHTLYLKADDETANGEDAKAVQSSWENRKEKLHIWIPHNDISRMDDYMAETVRLIAEKEHDVAVRNFFLPIGFDFFEVTLPAGAEHVHRLVHKPREVQIAHRKHLHILGIIP